MVDKAAGRCDNDMRAAIKAAAFVAHIHTANAGRQNGAGASIQPRQFALYLQGQFARWGNDQGKRAASGAECAVFGKNRFADGKAKADGFARTGLGTDQQVLTIQIGIRHGLLHGCEGIIALICKGAGECIDHGVWVRNKSACRPMPLDLVCPVSITVKLV